MEGHSSRQWDLHSQSTGVAGNEGEYDGPANPSVQTGVPRRHLTRQEQLALKPVVQRLYIEEGLTFAEVQRVLQTDYNFYPT